MNGNVFLFCIIMLLDLGFAVLCFSKIIKLFIVSDYKQIKKKEKTTESQKARNEYEEEKIFNR